jgi:hypothetical protein
LKEGQLSSIYEVKIAFAQAVQRTFTVPKTSAGQRGIEEAVVALRVLDSKAPAACLIAFITFCLSFVTFSFFLDSCRKLSCAISFSN